jgi:uncharacterized membrane protein
VATGDEGFAGNGDGERGVSNLQLTHIVYGLQAASFLIGITAIVAVIINYVRRDRVKGSWLASHFTWQIRTFWYSLAGGLLGTLTLALIVGGFILIAVTVWAIYRIVKGWLNLADGRPMYAGQSETGAR